jgi:signal transduction histidine kinase
VIGLASELRYDPNEDDAAPGRSPSAVLRVLTAAAATIRTAATAADVHEGICRALTDHGIATAILRARGADRFAPVAHRLGAVALAPLLHLPALTPALAGPVTFAGGDHPLGTVLPVEGALEFPAVVAPVPDGAGGPLVLSLFAPDIGPEHTAAVEAFAALLAATLTRVELEGRLRQAEARAAQRVRARTEELSAAQALTAALLAAPTAPELLRHTVAACVRLPGCDLAGGVLCVNGVHRLAVAARGTVAPTLSTRISLRMQERLAALAESLHGACAAGPVEAVAAEPLVSQDGHARRAAVEGEPAGVTEAPVIVAGQVRGLLTLVTLTHGAVPPERVRLLYAVANQLGAAATRVDRARAAESALVGELLEGHREAALLVDEGGRIVAANTAARSVLTAPGVATPDRAPPEVAAIAATALRRGRRTAGTLTPPATPPSPLAAEAVPVGDAGPAAMALVVLRPVDPPLVEKDHRTARMAAVGRLAADVAHELNSPLCSILGLTRLLALRDLDPEARGHVQMIAGEAERAARTVQHVLDLTRRRRPQKTPVDLNALIARAVRVWEHGGRPRGVTLHLEPAGDLPPVAVDPHRCQQVVVNLLTNAAQAIAGGAGQGTITVRTAARGGWARIEVEDDGPGIAAEHLGAIFEPFFTTKGQHGTGLGLAICRAIVDEHGGHIGVTSTPHRSTIFTVELPLGNDRGGPA